MKYLKIIDMLFISVFFSLVCFSAEITTETFNIDEPQSNRADRRAARRAERRATRVEARRNENRAARVETGRAERIETRRNERRATRRMQPTTSPGVFSVPAEEQPTRAAPNNGAEGLNGERVTGAWIDPYANDLLDAY